MATAEGVFPKVGGDPPFASEYNRFHNVISNPIVSTIINDASVNGTGIILAHSATDWTWIAGTSTITSDDSGLTWTNATTDNANMTGVSKASGANGFSCDTDSTEIYYTINSGVDWTISDTLPTNITRVFDASMPSSSIAVIACDRGTAASGIFFSTNGGIDW
ncbi:hypothetical protein LCGC14_2725270, partial [marine sediment metagenome]